MENISIKMIKKIFFILASIFLIFQTYQFLNGITDQEAFDRLGPALFFSWLLSLFITGIFAFAGFALPTEKLMPESYYKIKNDNKLNRFYKMLRVDIFKKLLIKFIYGKPKKKADYFNGKRSGLDHFITNTKKAEFGHLIPFILISFLMIYLSFNGKLLFGLGLLFFNTVGNFYPVLVQRHHRARLVRMGVLKRND
jgi:hypothetical protein